MAESSDGVGTWLAFVAQVNKTFNLLRDVFGDALPGGVSLAIGLISKRFSLSDVDDLLSPYRPPTWVYFISAVGACYIGDILAATAYLPTIWARFRFVAATSRTLTLWRRPLPRPSNSCSCRTRSNFGWSAAGMSRFNGPGIWSQRFRGPVMGPVIVSHRSQNGFREPSVSRVF